MKEQQKTSDNNNIKYLMRQLDVLYNTGLYINSQTISKDKIFLHCLLETSKHTNTSKPTYTHKNIH